MVLRAGFFMKGVRGASHSGAGSRAVREGRGRLGPTPLPPPAQPAGVCGVRVRSSRQVLFQAPGSTGLSVLQEVAAAIFTAPTRTFYRKVQLQAKCQGLAGQLIPGRLPQAKAGTMVVSVGL